MSRSIIRSRGRSGRPDREGQRGQAVALFAIMLTALLLGTGLVIDGGFAFVSRRDSQNAADMGSLAGTQVIADFHFNGGGAASDVWNAIDARVADNGCVPSGSTPCTWQASYIKPGAGGSVDPYVEIGAVASSGAIPADAQGVEVRIESHPGTFFLPLIGQDDWDVSADAAAITASMDDTPNGGVMLPIGVDPRTSPWDPTKFFQPNTPYEFSLGMDAPGNFSWLTWFGPVNANELADNICDARNPPYTFPVWIEGDVGKTNSSNVRACLSKYIGQTVVLPLWDQVQGQGNNTEFRVIGVAAFRLREWDANPAIDHLVGYFERIVSTTSIEGKYGSPPCNPAEPGCVSQSYFLGLIR